MWFEVGWHYIDGIADKIKEGEVDGCYFLLWDCYLVDEETFELGELGLGSWVKIGF